MFTLLQGLIAISPFPVGIYGIVTVPNKEAFFGSHGQKFNQGYAIN